MHACMPHVVLKLVQCTCISDNNVYVQLMVPRGEVVSELKRQGIDVADMDEQLCSMARNVVRAAQAQVGNVASVRESCHIRGFIWHCLVRCFCFNGYLQGDGIPFLALLVPHQLVLVCQIGRWPRSRAVYGLDVMLASGTNGRCSPQLLEVNFCPDFTSLLKYGTEEAINDFMMACFSSEPVSAERFQNLKEVSKDAIPGLEELELID